MSIPKEEQVIKPKGEEEKAAVVEEEMEQPVKDVEKEVPQETTTPPTPVENPQEKANDNIVQEQTEDLDLETHATKVTTTTTEEETVVAPPTAPPAEDYSNLPENVRILKEAFPNIDVEVIEAILQTQNDKLETSFELLLGMSDPNYEATPIPQKTQQPVTPPMPPRPGRQSEERRRSNSDNNAPYAYWERQPQPEPKTVEEQLRMDEEFAKKLAMEDEMRSEQRRQQYQQQQKREQDNDEDSIFNLQEELPIIKEKMKEAGNAAKKKVMEFYNQLKANTRNNSIPNQHESGASSSMPTTNAQYRGLPSDDGDDLLTGDISALHLSDYDVYAQTGGRQRKSNENKRGGDDVIHVNPPIGSSPPNVGLTKVQTSTSDAQLRADEDFARQLAEEEQLEATRRSRHSSNEDTLRQPQMQTRKSVTPTVVIAARSPLEFEGDSDYEDIGLTAAPSTTNTTMTTTNNNKSNALEENNSVPYVIGDDDDSDSDNLVDIDEDELFDNDDEEEVKKEEHVTSTAKDEPTTTTIKSDNTIKKDNTTTTTTTTTK